MPAFAIIQTGGKQYQVSPGDLIDVEKLPQEVGATVALDDVRMVAHQDGLLVGSPQVEGASVVAEVRDQLRGPKLIVFKYKAKTRYRKKNGHRQSYTRLLISQILVGGEVKAAIEQPKPPPRRRRAAQPRAQAEAAGTEAEEPKAETPTDVVSPPEAEAAPEPQEGAETPTDVVSPPEAERPEAETPTDVVSPPEAEAAPEPQEGAETPTDVVSPPEAERPEAETPTDVVSPPEAERPEAETPTDVVSPPEAERPEAEEPKAEPQEKQGNGT